MSQKIKITRQTPWLCKLVKGCLSTFRSEGIMPIRFSRDTLPLTTISDLWTCFKRRICGFGVICGLDAFGLIYELPLLNGAPLRHFDHRDKTQKPFSRKS